MFLFLCDPVSYINWSAVIFSIVVFIVSGNNPSKRGVLPLTNSLVKFSKLIDFPFAPYENATLNGSSVVLVTVWNGVTKTSLVGVVG